MAKKILTSIHGERIGLDVDGNLVVGGKKVTDITAEIGAKNGSSITEEVTDSGCFRKVKITCVATPLVLTDDPDVAVYGGVKVYDFPEGLLLFLGGVIDGAITAVDVLATFDGDVALGSATATTGSTLTGTEDDLLQSTALTQAIAKVANCDAITIGTALTESGARWMDGTTTAKDLFLNFVIDEDAANATSTGEFTGTIEFIYTILGDN